MAKRTVRTTRRRPGVVRRTGRWAVRLGVVAATAAVARRSGARGGGGGGGGGSPAAAGQGGGPAAASTATAGQGGAGSGGTAPGAAAGGEPPPEHAADPGRVPDAGRGQQAERPQDIPPKGWLDIAKRVRTEVKQDQVPLLAAGVAFYGLLSLFPAIIAMVSIYGLVASPETVRRQIESLTKMLSSQTSSLLTEQIQQITGGAGGALSVALVLGILTALWSASSGMKALITGVNMAYDETETRKFLKLRGLALVLTLGAMVLVGVALATIVGYPPVADTLPTVLRWLVAILRFAVLAALLIVGLAVIYRFAPDRDKPKWSWVSWGSGIATLLWVLATVAFAIYANFFGNYNKTYGTLAGLVILLFWMWLSAMVVLVGAELNAEMELQTAKDTTKGPQRPMGERQAHAADHVAAT
jgi:membrane protein